MPTDPMEKPTTAERTAGRALSFPTATRAFRRIFSHGSLRRPREDPT